MKLHLCPICNIKKPLYETFSGNAIRDTLYPFILQKKSDWSSDSTICLSCLNLARCSLVESFLTKELGTLSEAEKAVVDAIRHHELITENPEWVLAENITFGQRLADLIASFGGSWKFILIFLISLIFWIILNISNLLKASFDPYPFILLNLVLSCIAALQAPVIMMSQNRKESKDRYRAELDYRTNLKAELEIRHLHIKLDQLLSQQWHKLLEIQQIQTDLLRDLAEKRKST